MTITTRYFMDSWIIGIILAVVEVIITTAAGFIITSILKKKAAEREELEKLREEKRAAGEQQRCELVKSAIHEEVVQLEQDLTKKSVERHAELKDEIKGVKNEIDTINNDLTSMKRTMQKDTRRSLRQDAAFYIKRGWATGQEKTEYDELYWCYHNLGKNGVVDSDHAKVMALPEAPEGE